MLASKHKSDYFLIVIIRLPLDTHVCTCTRTLYSCPVLDDSNHSIPPILFDSTSSAAHIFLEYKLGTSYVLLIIT